MKVSIEQSSLIEKANKKRKEFHKDKLGSKIRKAVDMQSQLEEDLDFVVDNKKESIRKRLKNLEHEITKLRDKYHGIS